MRTVSRVRYFTSYQIEYSSWPSIFEVSRDNGTMQSSDLKKTNFSPRKHDTTRQPTDWTTDCSVCTNIFPTWTKVGLRVWWMKHVWFIQPFIQPLVHQLHHVYAPATWRPTGWMNCVNVPGAGDQSAVCCCWRHSDYVNVENDECVAGRRSETGAPPFKWKSCSFTKS